MAAPVGRPPMFETPELMQAAINTYLEANKDKPTLSGLALFLGFESRQSLYDYEEKPTFTYTIKRARLHLEVYYEEKLLTINSTGAIFALKNLGWKDKTEIDQTITEHKQLFKIGDKEFIL